MKQSYFLYWPYYYYFFLKAKPYDANMSIPPKQVDQQVIVIFVTAYDK